MLFVLHNWHWRLQEAAQLRDELAREYDNRAQAAVREKQQLDL